MKGSSVAGPAYYRLLAALLPLIAWSIGTREVSATWSIVAVDPSTREVGAAAATCTVGVEMIRGVVPGKGVILAPRAFGILGAARHWLFPYRPSEEAPPPVRQLREMYERWLTTHPSCAEDESH